MTARVPLPVELTRTPFTNSDGRTAGLGEGRLRGGDLYRPFRGIRTSSQPSDVEQLASAFQRRAAINTYLCCVTAARIYRMPLPLRLEQATDLHVGVPAPFRAPRVEGVVGHKYQIEESDIRMWADLRITTPERTWCDLATVLTLPDLVAVGDFLIHWELPLASRESLRETMNRHPGQRGRSRRLLAIDLLDNRSESRQESLLRVILVKARISGVATNLSVETSGGYRYRADLAIPDRKVIIEYQSRFHDGAKEFRADMTRISRLETDGWHVLQVNRDDLDNARELVQRIRTILIRRANLQ